MSVLSKYIFFFKKNFNVSTYEVSRNKIWVTRTAQLVEISTIALGLTSPGHPNHFREH
uniref:Uncharacterized protein n=1 Tax=Zea mays TaxID=4577 RepID=C4IZN0_MAIZE|nr:unknown [Zea mays]